MSLSCNSIPPMVEGPLRGEIELSVDRFQWLIEPSTMGIFRHNTPHEKLTVGFKWWGSQENKEEFGCIVCNKEGTIEERMQSDISCVKNFPVRASCQKLQQYLRDAKQLELAVYLGNKCIGNGHITIAQDFQVAPDSKSKLEGGISIYEAGDKIVANPIGILDVAFTIRLGENSFLLHSIEENILDDSKSISSSSSIKEEQNPDLMTSFELNELLANSDVSDMLPKVPKSSRNAFHPNIASDGTDSSTGSAPSSPTTGEVTTEMDANKRALEVIKRIRGRQTNSNGKNNEGSTSAPKTSTRSSKTENTGKTNVNNQTEESEQHRARKSEKKQPQLDVILSKAKALRDRMANSIDSKDVPHEVSSSVLTTESSSFDLSATTVDALSEAPSLASILHISPPREKTSSNPLESAIMPFTAATAAGLRVVDSWIIQVINAEVTPNPRNTAFDRWRIEMSLLLPHDDTSPYSSELEATPIIETDINPIRSKASASTSRPFPGKKKPAPPDAKPVLHKFRINHKLTTPVQFTDTLLLRWLRGKLRINMVRYDKMSEPQAKSVAAYGDISLRQLLIADNLLCSLAVQLFDPADNPKIASPVGTVTVVMQLLASNISNNEKDMIMKRAEIAQMVASPVTGIRPSDQTENSSLPAYCIEIPEIRCVMPTKVADKDITFRLRTQRQSTYDFHVGHRNGVHVPCDSLPSCLIFEVYDNEALLLGLAKIPSNPCEAWVKVTDPYVGITRLHVHVLIRDSNDEDIETTEISVPPPPPLIVEEVVANRTPSPKKTRGVVSTETSNTPTATSPIVKAETNHTSQGETSDTNQTSSSETTGDIECRENTSLKDATKVYVEHSPAKSPPSTKKSSSAVEYKHVFVFQPQGSCYRRDIPGMRILYTFPPRHTSKVSPGAHDRHEIWWDSNVVPENTCDQHLIEMTGDIKGIEKYLPSAQENLVFSFPDGATAVLPGFELLQVIQKANEAAKDFKVDKREDFYLQTRYSLALRVPILSSDASSTGHYFPLLVCYFRYRHASGDISPTKSPKVRTLDTRVRRERVHDANVVLAVIVERVDGLKRLAQAIANAGDSRMFLPAATGINASLTVELSADRGMVFQSPVIPKTFDPLLWADAETRFTLAVDPQMLEKLRSGTCTIRFWHHFEHDRVLLGTIATQLGKLFESEQGIHATFRVMSASTMGKAIENEVNADIRIFFHHHRGTLHLFEPKHILGAQPDQNPEDISPEILEEEPEAENPEHRSQDEGGADEQEEDLSSSSSLNLNITSEDSMQFENSQSMDATTNPSGMELLATSRDTKLKVTIDRAMHLPAVCAGKNLKLPNAYVVYQIESPKFTSRKYTNSVMSSCDPAWNATEVLPIDLYSSTLGQYVLYAHVWHRSEWTADSHHSVPPQRNENADAHMPPGTDFEPYGDHSIPNAKRRTPKYVYSRDDIYLGTAVVQLSSLQYGFHEINGWYHVIDRDQRRTGQIKLVIALDDATNTKVNDSVDSSSQAESDTEDLDDDVDHLRQLQLLMENLKSVDEHLASNDHLISESDSSISVLDMGLAEEAKIEQEDECTSGESFDSEVEHDIQEKNANETDCKTYTGATREHRLSSATSDCSVPPPMISVDVLDQVVDYDSDRTFRSDAEPSPEHHCTDLEKSFGPREASHSFSELAVSSDEGDEDIEITRGIEITPIVCPLIFEDPVRMPELPIVFPRYEVCKLVPLEDIFEEPLECGTLDTTTDTEPQGVPEDHAKLLEVDTISDTENDCVLDAIEPSMTDELNHDFDNSVTDEDCSDAEQEIQSTDDDEKSEKLSWMDPETARIARILKGAK